MKNKMKFVPLLVLILVALLRVGFSAFTESLSIDATAQVRLQENIRVTGITPTGSTNGGVANSEDYNVSRLAPNLTLPNANSTVTYTVQVTNYGNTKMEIFDITGLPNNLTYTLNGYTLDTLLCDNSISNKCTLGSMTTFTITIGYTNGGYNSSSTTYDLYLDLDFRIYDYYILTIVSDQNDSSLSLTTTEGTYTGTGSVSHRVKVGTSANYVVSKNLYYTVNENYTMGNQDHVINVTMELLKYTITFNPNGGSVNPTSKRVVYNTAIGELPTPTKQNAIFIGWFADTTAQHSNVSYKNDPLLYYADSYGDLYNAFGYDDNGLYTHYLNNGNGEGRRISQYIATDVMPTNNDVTFYAGWIYKWEKFSKKVGFDERLTISGTESGGIVANSYFWYHEKAKLNEIASISNQNLTFTQGMKSSISNKLPDHDVYVFAANSDSIKTGSWTTSGSPSTTVDHYCVITNSRVTLVAYITCDIYEVYNIRYVKGDTSYGYVYYTNSSTYPSNGESGDNWYILQ